MTNPLSVQNGYPLIKRSLEGDSDTAWIFFEPLRYEDLITRRISAPTQPILVRKGIDLAPET